MTWDWVPIWDGEFSDFREEEDIYNALMSLLCVICAGLAAGLTMGLLSLDVTKLELKTITGTRHEKSYAKSILPIVKRHHFLLVTLLLFNSVSNESLPIFLGALFPNYVAILISVSAILIFGEILPSALFTGPRQLAMASYLTPLVWFLMTCFWPIAYPISIVLDWIFGAEEQSSVLSREEFQALVMLQSLQKKPQKQSNTQLNTSENGRNLLNHDNDNVNNRTPGLVKTNSSSNITSPHYNHPHHHQHHQHQSKISPTEATVLNSRGTHPYSYESHQDRLTVTEKYDAHLSAEELSIMAGVLKLTKLTVRDIMIPAQCVHMISDATVLSHSNLVNILSTGYSRLPVYRGADKQRIRGYLLVKSLAALNSNETINVSSLTLREPLFLRPDTSVLEALSVFRKSRCHLAMICEDPLRAVRLMRSDEFMAYEPKMLGIVTMEDAIEEIIQNEILDETDVLRPLSPDLASTTAHHGTGGLLNPLYQSIQLGPSRGSASSGRQ